MALKQRKNPNSYYQRLTLLKKLFWLYFLLLIFEGALRKWVAPQLSAPLLIVRDPVAIWIIWEAYRTQKWPARWSAVISLLSVLLVGLFVLQISVGENPFIVGLYGLRSYLLPFPVIFIIGDTLDEEDLQKLCACTLWVLLPMTILEVAQYSAGPGSILNKGAYQGGVQLGYVGGHVRSSGTFSFVVGAEEFGVLAAAFIFYGTVSELFAKKWMLWLAAFALIISIPTMGSRSIVVQVVAMIACMGIGALMGISQFGRVLSVIVPFIIVGFLASLLPVFSDAMYNMTQRFAGANTAEGGSAQSALIYRTVQPAVNAIEQSVDSSNWMGIGMGRGAVAMQALLYGTTEGVAGEDEFSHELVEMGPIGGIGFELFKFFLAIMIIGKALVCAREHRPLALLLCPLAVAMLFFATFEQPSLQGFAVISVAFCIASTRSIGVPVLTTAAFGSSANPVVFARRVRRRSL